MRRFRQVDVFGASVLLGNPVAVVLDAQDLTDEQMQRLARWTNLSETTFVLPPQHPDAHYRLRIFTPDEELPFAGHPTLGSCHAWLEAGGSAADVVVQECGAGLVRVRRGELLAFEAPPLVRSGPLTQRDRRRVIRALGADPADVVDAAWVDNGPGWVAVRLCDRRAVLALRPADLDGFYIGAVATDGQGAEVRAFFPANGVCAEDPVTGSLNASLAHWLVDSGALTFPYEAQQGRVLHRDGRVHLSRDDSGAIWVAGATVTVVSGTIPQSV